MHFSTIWTIMVGTAAGMVFMFNTFVSAEEFNELAVELYYVAYYRSVDELREIHHDDDRRRIERTLSRLRSKICAIEPEWEECN